VGGYLAARLSDAGREVEVLARGANLAAVRARGIEVRGDEAYGPHPVMASETPLPGAAGLVIMTVKTYDLDAAGDLIAPVVGPKTAILTLQNGVEAPERLAQRFGPGRVLAGSIYIVSGLLEPGVIEKVGRGYRIDFGEMAGAPTTRSAAVAELLRAGGAQVEVRPDFRASLWEKYLVLAAMSTVTSACMLSLGEIRREPEGLALLQRAVRETGAVGRALGVGITDEAVEATAQRMTLAPDGTKSSMQRDFEKGRPVELEDITGAVIRLGRQVGVPTPTYDALYPVLRARAEAARLARGDAS
jgi:2-dehydropantoate 2-reductase